MNKKILFIATFILIGVLFIVFLNINKSVSQEDEGEEIIKDLIRDDISKHENLNGADIIFEKIDLKNNSAEVDVRLSWGPGLCVGYHYKLQKLFGNWKIISREKTIVC